jgi:hypothetical protein
MPKKTTEEDDRWDDAIEAIDEALDSDDLSAAITGAVAWALVDIADSLNVLSQHFEKLDVGFVKPRARQRKPKAPKAPKRKRARAGADEEDE